MLTVPPGCASLTYISAADGKWWFIHLERNGVATAIFSLNPFKNVLGGGLKNEHFLHPPNQRAATLHFPSCMVNLSGFKIHSCCVFASVRVGNTEDATLCPFRNRSNTCTGVYKDNDVPVFSRLRRQISITVDSLMWLQDHLCRVQRRDFGRD